MGYAITRRTKALASLALRTVFARLFSQPWRKPHVSHQKVTGNFPTARDAVRRVRRTRTLVAPRTKAEHAAARVHAVTIRIPAKDNPGTTARGESRGRSFAHTCSKHGWCPACRQSASCSACVRRLGHGDKCGRRLPPGPLNAKAFPDGPEGLARPRGQKRVLKPRATTYRAGVSIPADRGEPLGA